MVLTFDDITRLVTAQRNAAWRDVARRIAHEIKNPLTPIQLSAERLRKKYRKDRSWTRWRSSTAAPTPSSARLATSAGWWTNSRPSPACPRRVSPPGQPPAELLREAVFAQRVAAADIGVDLIEPLPKVRACGADERMVGQALANILKNAGEAVARGVPSAQATAPGRMPGIIGAWLSIENETATFVRSRTTAWACPPRTATG